LSALGSVGIFREQRYSGTYAEPDYSSNSTLVADAVFTINGVSGTMAVGAASASSSFTITSAELMLLYQMHLLHGLGTAPLHIGPTSRTSGDLVQSISGTETVTISTVASPTVVMQAPGDMIRELAALHGLTVSLVNASGTRSAGAISQTITLADGAVTVQRI
jgi:hypothetical protein